MTGLRNLTVGTTNYKVANGITIEARTDKNVSNKQVSIYDAQGIHRIDNEGHDRGKQASMSMPYDLQNILAEVEAADKKDGALTEADIRKFVANKSKYKGLTIRHDAKAGVVTITNSNNKFLKVTYQTAEQVAAQNSAKADEKAEATRNARQQKVNQMVEAARANKNYSSFKVDKNGYVTVTLKEDRSYEEVLSDFQLNSKTFPKKRAGYKAGEKIAIHYSLFKVSDQSNWLEKTGDAILDMISDYVDKYGW